MLRTMDRALDGNKKLLSSAYVRAFFRTRSAPLLLVAIFFRTCEKFVEPSAAAPDKAQSSLKIYTNESRKAIGESDETQWR